MGTAAKPAPGRILIIEDEPDVLEVLKLLLEYEGHKVVTAKSGAAALQAARERSFDVVVLDITMPDMSGIEIARSLRADPKSAGARIAVHSGLEERWVKERFPAYDLFFAKAKDVERLVEGVARLLAKPAPATAGAAAAPPYSADDAVRARNGLRVALGLGGRLTAAELVGEIGNEIDRLRDAGKAEAEIAEAIGSAIGRPFPAALLAEHRPLRDKRHAPR